MSFGANECFPNDWRLVMCKRQMQPSFKHRKIRTVFHTHTFESKANTSVLVFCVDFQHTICTSLYYMKHDTTPYTTQHKHKHQFTQLRKAKVEKNEVYTITFDGCWMCVTLWRKRWNYDFFLFLFFCSTIYLFDYFLASVVCTFSALTDAFAVIVCINDFSCFLFLRVCAGSKQNV